MADVGERAASKSTGLVRLAARSAHNAERDCHRLLVGQYELALPVPITELKSGDPESELSLPVLRLRDWAQFLISKNHTHIMTGLLKPDWKRESAILSAFWRRYELQHPTHPVFQAARDGRLKLSQTFPMVCHGDEGRGRKRQAFLVVNMHSLLGRGLRQKRKKNAPKRYLKMLPNFHGHSLTSRLLLAAMPKTMYTGDNGHVWDSLMELVTSEAEHMYFTGVEDDTFGRGRFNMVLLHICGDWPFLVDSGNLRRSFRNVPKHKTRRSLPIGICHWCSAGQQNWDYEEINSERPAFLSTMFRDEICVDPNDPSPFTRLPHWPGQTGFLFMWDVFHTMHLGVCKQFLGSFLALVSEEQQRGSVDARFEVVTSKYLEWCKNARKRTFVTKLTKEQINWTSTTQFPVGAWHKGAFSTTLMAFAQFLYETEGASWPLHLQKAGAAAVSCNLFLKVQYDGEAWLTATQARKAAMHGLDFLSSYAALAHEAWCSHRCLWIVQPKMHCMHHLSLYLLDGSQKGRTINPICYSTQQDEDFIGRPSRTSRRVTPKAIQSCRRVIERYLQSAYSEWVRVGYIVATPPGQR